MGFLTDWVTNIIVLVLLAGVIELLLPGNQFQSYIKMVIGLLILLAMLSPLFKLLNSDINQVFQAMDVPAAAKENEIKNSIEKNKSEIQGAQRAYILEQMAVPMKEKVQEELKKTYELEIVDLQIQTKSGTETLNPNDITGLKVVLAKHHESAGISEVSEVEVSIADHREQADKDEVPEKIIEFLASQWQLDKAQLEVEMEGGEESSQ
ncbi:stage III sporulation protein AF [Fictibacillus phosphorivorans]|uniref:stage III sporulation protein AF n=1 Tax=Fictibacillus phosphorivorans TaxID=1221500 RepID=UPI00203B569C|nr:stage III sporulation protein AF [Fictibacillus phosphorivorans]MCM3716759.1 stage III sporulation protein AF [Fictibacillus phosphorivorans]MCM3774692.1 stage III sporulation protein AF [Fictibacillus phosphorivorans]